MLSWIYLTIVALGALIWAAWNLSPSRRNNLNYRIDWPPPTPPATPAAFADKPTPQPLPRIAIICPGRNEASWIRTTLPELCQQDYPDYRVVYVDDHSSDETPAITAACAARFPHLIVLRNEIEPPVGWVGKCWAVQRGYQALMEYENRTGWRADFVCFTDADIHWNPPALRGATVHQQQHDADVVSVFPKLEFGFVAEKLALSMMVMAIGIAFPFQKAMDPKHPDTVTAGAFMLVRRKLYDQIGGHEAVRSMVVEDMNLGRKLKAEGGKIRLGATTTLLRCRMYEDFPDMWEGLTKNAFAGMDYRYDLLAGLVGGMVFSNILAPIYPVISLWWLLASDPSHRAMPITALVCALLMLALQIRAMNVVRKAIELPWPYAFSLPAGSVLYLTFILVSVYRYHFGGNVWKGRAYGKATVQT